MSETAEKNKNDIDPERIKKRNKELWQAAYFSVSWGVC